MRRKIKEGERDILGRNKEEKRQSGKRGCKREKDIRNMRM